jgi:hypothetical protein
MTDDRDHLVWAVLWRIGGGIRSSFRSHPLAGSMAALVVCITAAAVVLGSIRIEAAQNSAVSDQHAQQMASLASAVNQLVAAMEDEQDDLASYVAAGRPDAAYALLFAQGQESTTTDLATRAVSLARHSGPGLAPQVEAALLAMQAKKLPALRGEAVRTQATALNVIQDYSAAISSLLTLDTQIASGSGDPVLVRDVRAFSAMQRAEDAGAQERSILGAALTAGKWQPGQWRALSTAQSQQQAALSEFDSEATAGQQQAYLNAVSGVPVGYATQMLQQALTSGSTGGLTVTSPGGYFNTVAGIQGAWNQEMQFTLDQMRAVEQNLLSQIQARSQALHAQATRIIPETWLEMAAIVLVVVALAVGVTWRRRSRAAVR